MSDTKTSFFSPIGNNKPFLKANLFGLAGTGKTHTATLFAIGLHKKIGSKKPIVMFDTEHASKFLKELYAEAEIECVIKESRSLADLKETMRIMREGYSDILVIDSITHIWNNLIEAHKRHKNRTYLTMFDWGVIKPAWFSEFSDPFVNDPYHVIMCGRAGDIFTQEMNEETGKKEMTVTGVRMKVEKETAHEPDLLIHMNQEQMLEGGKITSIVRTATILKDRSRLIDGKTFINPKFSDVEPLVDWLLKDPVKRSTIAERDSAELIKTEEDKKEWRTRKEIALEEIQNYCVSVWAGRTGEDNKNKVDVLNYAFGTFSWKAIEIMPLDKIEAGLIKVKEYGGKYVARKKKELEKEIKSVSDKKK